MDLILGFIILYVWAAGIYHLFHFLFPGIPESSDYDPNEWYGGGPDPMA